MRSPEVVSEATSPRVPLLIIGKATGSTTPSALTRVPHSRTGATRIGLEPFSAHATKNAEPVHPARGETKNPFGATAMGGESSTPPLLPTRVARMVTPSAHVTRNSSRPYAAATSEAPNGPRKIVIGASSVLSNATRRPSTPKSSDGQTMSHELAPNAALNGRADR